MIGWIQHWLGFRNGDGNGAPYLFWSGFFADVVIFTAVLQYFKTHNCHVKGCWRVWNVHEVVGTPYKACRTHHPVVSDKQPITPQDLEQAHKRAADAGLVAHRDHTTQGAQ